MRRTNFYMWLLALIGIATACNHDESANNYAEENNRVTIGASVNPGVSTRAGTPETLPGYTMRFVLEVWQLDKNIYREEKLQQNGEMTFSFNLENQGEYKVLVWADYIKEAPETTEQSSPNLYNHYADLYYQTNTANGLKEVTIIPENYIVNNAGRDAFCVCKTITKTAFALNENLVLNRPFGQLNLIEKDTSLLVKVQKINCTYKVPDTFNVETGQQGAATIDINAPVETLPAKGANHKSNLLYDYIFAPTGTAAYLSPLTLTFTSTDPLYDLNTFTLPENTLPLLRNKRTNARGSIIKLTSTGSSETNITVQVDAEWLPDQEQPIASADNKGNLADFQNSTNPF